MICKVQVPKYANWHHARHAKEQMDPGDLILTRLLPNSGKTHCEEFKKCSTNTWALKAENLGNLGGRNLGKCQLDTKPEKPFGLFKVLWWPP